MPYTIGMATIKYPQHGPQPFSKYDWEKPSPLYRVLADKIVFGSEDPQWSYVWIFAQPERGWICFNSHAPHRLGYVDLNGVQHAPFQAGE